MLKIFIFFILSQPFLIISILLSFPPTKFPWFCFYKYGDIISTERVYCFGLKRVSLPQVFIRRNATPGCFGRWWKLSWQVSAHLQISISIRETGPWSIKQLFVLHSYYIHRAKQILLQKSQTEGLFSNVFIGIFQIIIIYFYIRELIFSYKCNF